MTHDAPTKTTPPSLSQRARAAVALLCGACAVPAIAPEALAASRTPTPEISTESLVYANALSDAFQAVAQAVGPAVVNIRATSARRSGAQPGVGTGVIFSEDGLILTNNHVVAGASRVLVTLSDGRAYPAEVVGLDANTDLGVLRIDAPDLTAAALGDSDTAQVGQWVVAIGNPFGLDQTVTAGIISARGRSGLRLAEYEDFIQTDAAINPGNSGGPLVNLNGEVIAINSAITSRSGGSVGIGFAIPINMASYIARSIVEDGQVVRGWLGVSMAPVNTERASFHEYDGNDGVYIARVLPSSPADRSGFAMGDIVTRFDGRDIESPNQLRNAIALTPPGHEVDIELFRDGEFITLPVKLGDKDLAASQTLATTTRVPQLGLTLDTLTPTLAQRLRFKRDVEAAVVVTVEPGSVAYRAGIRPGQLIVSVEGERVRTASAVASAIDNINLRQGARLRVVDGRGVTHNLVLRSG